MWVSEPKGWVWVPDGWVPRYPGGPGAGAWRREGAHWIWVPEAGGQRTMWTWRRSSMLALVAVLWMAITITGYAAVFRVAEKAPATSVTTPITSDGGAVAGLQQTAPPINTTSHPSPAPYTLAKTDVTLNFTEATGGCPGFGNGPLPASISASGGVLSIALPERPGVPARTSSGTIDSSGYLRVASTDPTEKFEGQIRQGSLTSRYEITIGSCTESYTVTAQLP